MPSSKKTLFILAGRELKLLLEQRHLEMIGRDYLPEVLRTALQAGAAWPVGA